MGHVERTADDAIGPVWVTIGETRIFLPVESFTSATLAAISPEAEALIVEFGDVSVTFQDVLEVLDGPDEA